VKKKPDQFGVTGISTLSPLLAAQGREPVMRGEKKKKKKRKGKKKEKISGAC